jgi:hypothetical protein
MCKYRKKNLCGNVQKTRRVRELCGKPTRQHSVRNLCGIPSELPRLAGKRLTLDLDREESQHSIMKGNQSSKTHCPQGHAYFGLNLTLDSRGKRVCPVCAAIRDKLAWSKLQLLKQAAPN